MSKKYTAYIALFSLTISHHVCAQVMSELGTNNTPSSSGFGYYQAPVAKDSNVKSAPALNVPSNYSGFGYTQAKPSVNPTSEITGTSSSTAAAPTPSLPINPNASNFGGGISTNSAPSTQALALPEQPANPPIVQQNNTVTSSLPTQQTNNIHHASEIKKSDELASIQALSDYEESDPYRRRKSSFGHFQVNNSDEEPASMYNNQNLELGKGLTLLPDDDIVGSNLRSGKTNVFGYKKMRKQKQNAFLIPGKRRTGLIVTASGEQFEKEQASKDLSTTPLDDNIDQNNESAATTVNADSVQTATVEDPAPAPVAAPSKGGLLDSITSIATAVATVADTFSGTKPAAPVDTKGTVTKSSATVSTSSSSTNDSNDTSASSNSNESASTTTTETPAELKSIVTQEVSTQLPPLVQAEVARQLGQVNPNNIVQQPIPAAPPTYDQPLEELPVFVAK
ncbi:MAG: hypothetical protein C0432_05140 [Candidatus Puniceispirillum sp.]|nr:hypothetical protein [Candidatus Pelagibacter sp.]MBA4283660.1 hypothetical protein [Candidatus Puniceispirillum sp.]